MQEDASPPASEVAASRESPADACRVPVLAVRSASLDGVRVVLSLAVLAYHLSGTIALPKYFDVRAFAALFSVGDARIPFFFVLSGFLLTLLHGGDPVGIASARRFAWRRATRIFPAYWLVLAATALVVAVLPGYADRLPAADVLVKAALLVPQEHDVGGPTGAPLLVAAWTLHYEIAFYAVVAACIASRPVGALLVLLLAGNLFACGERECGFYREFLASHHAVHFAIGAGAAWLARRAAPSHGGRRVAGIALALYAALIAVEYTVPDPGDRAHWSFAYALLAGTILLGLVRAEGARPARASPRWLAALSRSSYALYLLHFPLISAGCKLLVLAGMRGAIGATVAFVVIASGCLAAAYVFNRYVERPVDAWLAG